MIQPGKETNPVFPVRPGAGASPNLSNVTQAPFLQTKIFGVDGVTITVGLIVLLVALWLGYSVLFSKKRR